MSILRSYYNKNNTLEYNNYTNTGRNPVTQLFFGGDLATFAPRGFTRFLFDLDLDSSDFFLVTIHIYFIFFCMQKE